MNAAPQVYTAVANVMAEMAREGIAKGRRNQQQGYQFRGIDDVYNALAPVLAKNKLVITPRVKQRTCEERTTQRGGSLFYVTVEVEYELASAEDGSTLIAQTYGEAMDSADKATNKAMSAAYKYLAMQQFCIPTEGDNDADATTPDPVQPRETARQRAARETEANGGTHPNNADDADDFDVAATALRIQDLLKLAQTKEDLGRAWNKETRADRARIKAADPTIYKSLTDALEFETQRLASPQRDDVLGDDVPF